MPIENRKVVLWLAFALALAAVFSVNAAGDVRVWEEALTLPTY